jgi:hypothetical protein
LVLARAAQVVWFRERVGKTERRLRKVMVVAFARKLLDRAGPRAVYTTGLTLIGVGLWVASLATRLWHLQVFVGLGAACLGNVSNASLVAVVQNASNADHEYRILVLRDRHAGCRSDDAGGHRRTWLA